MFFLIPNSHSLAPKKKKTHHLSRQMIGWFHSWQVDGRAVGLMCLTSDVDINVPWIRCWHNKSCLVGIETAGFCLQMLWCKRWHLQESLLFMFFLKKTGKGKYQPFFFSGFMFGVVQLSPWWSKVLPLKKRSLEDDPTYFLRSSSVVSRGGL